MAKMSIDFSGMDAYIKKLSAFEGAAKRAADTALKKTQSLIAEQVTGAMEPHEKSGGTAEQIIRSKPAEWTGSTAKVSVGFEIGDTDRQKEGDRLASVFLMYGTKVYGQPHEAPDRALYNAVYGRSTKARIREIQKAAFENAIREVFG